MNVRSSQHAARRISAIGAWWPDRLGVASYRVRAFDASAEPFAVIEKGRVRSALERLREAGPDGRTHITEPGPRWSDYVHKLRGQGVPVETVTEGARGPPPRPGSR